MLRRGSLLIAFLALFVAAPALAADDEDRGRQGGRAEENRSERADENSNAQWSDDAKRGQDRAEERKGSKKRDGSAEGREGKKGKAKEGSKGGKPHEGGKAGKGGKPHEGGKAGKKQKGVDEVDD